MARNKHSNNAASRFAVVDDETTTSALTVDNGAADDVNAITTEPGCGYLCIRNPSASTVFWSTTAGEGEDGMPIAAGGAEDLPMRGGTTVYFYVASGTNKIHFAQLKA